MVLPFVRTTIERDEVDSTSDLAKSLVEDASIPLPMVVRAARQSHGRGRGDHAWWSDEGSLTFTIALDPAAHGLRPEHEPRLALATAVALIDAIVAFAPGAPLGIRWPNDVEASGRKVAGLLPERIETAGGPRLLVGIGVNVRTRLDWAPPEIRAMATTVDELRGRGSSEMEVEALFEAILARFRAVLPMLATNEPALSRRWMALDALGGRPIRVDVGPKVLDAQCLGIDEGGASRSRKTGNSRPCSAARSFATLEPQSPMISAARLNPSS